MKDRALFLTFQPIISCDGVSKKVFAQRDGIIQNGYECDIIYPNWKDNGNLIFKINDEILIDDVKRRALTFPKSLYDYILQEIRRKSYKILYIRYCLNSGMAFRYFLKKCQNLGLCVYMEIPTYPYDKEIAGFRNFVRFAWIEKLFRKCCFSCVNKVVTFSDFTNIYGKETIRIANAVSSVPPLKKIKNNTEDIVCVTVANVAFWHGIDRFIEGLNIYYKNKEENKTIVRFKVIGEGDTNVMRYLKELVTKYRLDKFVTFEGAKEGSQLDTYFDEANIAIGCLACHRKNIKRIRSLKNVEYAMRGIPFIYSEESPDFDGMSFIRKMPANDDPINIDNVVDFIKSINILPAKICEEAQAFTWANQMKIVLNE